MRPAIGHYRSLFAIIKLERPHDEKPIRLEPDLGLPQRSFPGLALPFLPEAHSVRGFLSSAIKKKMGLPVDSAPRDNGQRAYRLVSK